MKKLILLLLPLFFLGSCNKKNITVDYNYNFTTIRFRVNPMTAGVQAIDQKTLVTNFDSFCVAKNIDPNHVNSIHLSSANAFLADSTQNFDEFESARLYVSAPNQPEIEIASKNHTPNGSNDLNDFILTNENIINYVKSNEITVRMEGTLRNDITVIKNVLLKVEFRINADILQVK
jgi:hypothetical protein